MQSISRLLCEQGNDECLLQAMDYVIHRKPSHHVNYDGRLWPFSVHIATSLLTVTASKMPVQGISLPRYLTHHSVPYSRTYLQDLGYTNNH